jgi:hypothetical protein
MTCLLVIHQRSDGLVDVTAVGPFGPVGGLADRVDLRCVASRERAAAFLAATGAATYREALDFLREEWLVRRVRGAA